MIDPGLCLAGAAMGDVAVEERVARATTLSSDLDPGGTGGELGDGSHFRMRCVRGLIRRRRAGSGKLGAYSRVSASAANNLKIHEKCR